MQSQFTDKARTALQLAERAARRMRQGYVGTEHILLGLLEEGTGTAARVLAENGANEQEIRDMIRDLIAPVLLSRSKRGTAIPRGRWPFWRRPTGRRPVLVLSLQERSIFCSP